MSDAQLCETLKEYILQDVPVPDFLVEELSSRGAVPELMALLNETDEELVMYALGALGPDRRAVPRYAAMLGEDAYDEHVKDHLAELLKERADDAADAMLALAKTENAPYALEVLSKVKKRDERVYAVLLSAFRAADEEELPLYAGYLGLLRRRARAARAALRDRAGGHRLCRLPGTEIRHRSAGRRIRKGARLLRRRGVQKDHGGDGGRRHLRQGEKEVSSFRSRGCFAACAPRLLPRVRKIPPPLDKRRRKLYNKITTRARPFNG